MSTFRNASSRRGFTLVEGLVVFAVVVIFVVVFLVPGSFFTGPNREIANRAFCGTNLRGLVQSMLIYAQVNDDAFPAAGEQNPAAPVQGFRSADLRGRNRVRVDDPAMVNNATASLWMLVRDGSASVESFICPHSRDVEDDLRDGEMCLSLSETWDFAARENLSYSTLNMYHVGVRAAGLWSNNVPGDVALIADRNDGDHPAVHTPDSPNDNSPNHGGEGQNVAFGDGSVRFVETPKVGPGGDDVYAMLFDGTPGPPTLGLTDGDMGRAVLDPRGELTYPVARRDNVLIPLSGNQGVSLSGLPGEVVPPRPETIEWFSPIALALISVAGLAAAALIIWLALRLSRRRAAAAG